MISFDKKQIDVISKLNPLSESKFKYNSTRWKKLNEGYKGMIEEYEGKKISRQDIIDAYKEYYDDASKGWVKAFLLTMVWGFADTGYGTHRTNNYISTEENRVIIKNAMDYINTNENNSLGIAFNELKKIKGLGISYLTKILYFATRAKNKDRYALIFDTRVAASLIKLTTPKEVYDIVSIGPSSAFQNYEKYIKMIHETAENINVDADQIEMFLFNQDSE